MFKPCFLINVSERPEVVINQICNIKILSPNSIVVIHISGNTKDQFLQDCSKLDFDFFKRLEQLNCFVNPENVPTLFGHYLAEAFISSFEYITSIDIGKDIDKVILNASNQLYFKPLDEHLQEFDAGQYNFQPYKAKTDLHPENNLMKLVCGDPKSSWCWSWHEGAFYNANDFRKAIDYIYYAKEHNIFITPYDTKEYFGRYGELSEETTIPSVYNAMIKDRKDVKVTTPLIIMHNNLYDLIEAKELINDILYNDSKWLASSKFTNEYFHPHFKNRKSFYGIKRVDRSLSCPVRQYITSILPKHPLDTIR